MSSITGYAPPILKIGRSNHIGFLRFLFAVLVIVSHSPELVDGNRSREVLTSIFGTISFGEFGVDGFFLLSGYLICKSFCESRSAINFLRGRILRIYPAFIVAYIISLLILAPLGGGKWDAFTSVAMLIREGAKILLLALPSSTGVFTGLHVPNLNGSMWTIAYEFRCYLLIFILGITGLLAKRWFVLSLCAAFLAMYVSGILNSQVAYVTGWIGAPDSPFRFTFIFLCGSCYYLFRDRIVYNWRNATICLIILIPLLFIKSTAQPALAVFGGFICLWIGLHIRAGLIAKINGSFDISYGVYLYAWPIQNLLIYYIPGISPASLCVATLLLTVPMGFASWFLIEKPALAWKNG